MVKKMQKSHTYDAVIVSLDRIEEKIDALHRLQAEAKSPALTIEPVNVKTINLILRLIAEGRKVEAIKEYRAYFGVGLKEAKDAIEGDGL